MERRVGAERARLAAIDEELGDLRLRRVGVLAVIGFLEGVLQEPKAPRASRTPTPPSPGSAAPGRDPRLVKALARHGTVAERLTTLVAARGGLRPRDLTKLAARHGVRFNPASVHTILSGEVKRGALRRDGEGRYWAKGAAAADPKRSGRSSKRTKAPKRAPKARAHRG